jgi:hypothetical protein
VVRLVYYDEAGDDGFPRYSSACFVLSAVYMPYLAWRTNFEALHEFRQELRKQVGLPIRTEFHTRQFLTNKRPYRDLGIPEADRLSVIQRYCDLLGRLDIRVINVCIDKTRIHKKTYPVLDWALKFSIQRIENDLRADGDADSRFLVITDPGRVGKMRKTTRKVQRINFIPSLYGRYSYRREIERMIEDPLPKDSRESYFIQSADLVTYVVYLYTFFEKGVGQVHGRLPGAVGGPLVRDWMDRLRPSLNLAASGADPYGVFYHPR